LWSFGTGNFTIETWMYAIGVPANHSCFISCATSGAGWHLGFGIDGAGKIRLVSNASGEWAEDLITSNGVLNAWVHVALVRNGNILTIYTNGVSAVAKNVTGYNYASTQIPGIGRTYGDTDDYYYKGFLDETRISKGTAQYTANFTPTTNAFSVMALTTNFYLRARCGTAGAVTNLASWINL
jgi:hypothetical protein